MSNKYQVLRGDIEELAMRMKTAKKKDEFRRFQVMFLRLSKGLPVAEIAELTCYSKSWIRQLHSIYRYGGVEELAVAERGGRYHENMTVSEEGEFIEPFLARRESSGDFDIGEIRRLYEKKAKRKVGLSVIYLLLHRHGWRKRRSHMRLEAIDN